MYFHGFSWISMDFWIFMDFHENRWKKSVAPQKNVSNFHKKVCQRNRKKCGTTPDLDPFCFILKRDFDTFRLKKSVVPHFFRFR